MENNNIENNMVNRPGKVWAGVLIIGVGVMLLLQNVGVEFPSWLFRWHTLLMVIGLVIGLKHGFRHSGWLIMVLIGGIFTARSAFDLDIDFGRVILPILLVVFGLVLILKPKGSFNRHSDKWRRKSERWKRKYGATDQYTSFTETPISDAPQQAANINDYLDSVNVFGGSHQTVYSKNFKGGEVVAVFGGCDLNLTQSDFEGTIELDVTAIFGGCKIIIPAGWQVKSEITAIFGGVDDKRSIQPIGEGAQKLLVLRGIAMFGGVDIRNY